MAISAVGDVGRLDDGYILAPERYDPRRRFVEQSNTRLSDIVNLLREQTSAATADVAQQFLVIATGDARDGIIRPTVSPCDGSDIGSTKRLIRPGQVIISRLRPYLRQVAWIDAGLPESMEGRVELACSSEFYVLDSKDGASIAFLVPFLLSNRVQSVLAASQEGGHHPRFNEHTLKSLPIPTLLLERRAELSARVECAVSRARQAFGEIHDSIGAVDASTGTTRSHDVEWLRTAH